MRSYWHKVWGWVEALILLLCGCASITLLLFTETRTLVFAKGMTSFVIIVYFFWCLSLARKRAQITCAIDIGIPLTRANTADLPALDSLVRASAEPMHAQEALLLRAVTQTQEKREEQLLRAAEVQE